MKQDKLVSNLGYALFETAIGMCAIAWRGDDPRHEIVLSQLPDADAGATRARILRRFRGARESEPPAAIGEAIRGIAALLRGEKVDLSSIPLDMSQVPPFHRRVFEAARAIRPGQTRTYGQIAVAIGEPEAAQAVGRALGANPFAPVVPCHRVLAAGRKMHGFSAHGGIATKRRMLEIEGALARQFDLFERVG